jgi:hypothetical protein
MVWGTPMGRLSQMEIGVQGDSTSMFTRIRVGWCYRCSPAPSHGKNRLLSRFEQVSEFLTQSEGDLCQKRTYGFALTGLLVTSRIGINRPIRHFHDILHSSGSVLREQTLPEEHRCNCNNSNTNTASASFLPVATMLTSAQLQYVQFQPKGRFCLSRRMVQFPQMNPVGSVTSWLLVLDGMIIKTELLDPFVNN